MPRVPKSSPLHKDLVASASPELRPVAERLHALVREAAPELREERKWNRLAFVGRNIVCGLVAFQRWVGLGFWRERELKGFDRVLNPGKFSRLEDIPENEVRACVRAAVALDATPPPARPRGPARKVPVPAELSVALERDPRAGEFFASLPPSARNEYSEWIGEAKRPETRARRLAETLCRLRAGRRYNDEYK